MIKRRVSLTESIILDEEIDEEIVESNEVIDTEIDWGTDRLMSF